MESTEAISVMGALAQPTRLRVVAVLKREYPNGVPVGEIAARVATPQNTMSTHLAILSHAGLVEAEREGRIIRYKFMPGGLDDLIEYLSSDLSLHATADNGAVAS